MVNNETGGRPQVIIKVSYHVLGPLIFGFGLMLVLKLPNSDGLLGDQFFNLLSDGNDITIRIAAAILQMIGIVFFLKWFGEHGKKEHVKFYKKFEPFILIFLIFLTPIILNDTIASTVKAYIYAGKSGKDAVEIAETQQPCTLNAKDKLANCSITLKNYNHASQKVLLQVKWGMLMKSSTTPVYLIKHQEKTVMIPIRLNPSELKQIEKNEKNQQPQITIQ